MIYIPFCISRNADSEYTKHHGIRFKYKGDKFAEIPGKSVK